MALIDWAYNLRIIGWILRIGGALFLLAFVFQGFLLSLFLIGSVIGELRKGKAEPSWFQRHLNWALILGYLAIFLIGWILDRVIPTLPILTELTTMVFIAISLWALTIMLVIWYLKRKGRSLWHLLWAIPLGLIPVIGVPALLCLRNKRRAVSPVGMETIDRQSTPE
ncbi:MAG: hypothetical protein R6U93_00445 [Dehalococcoidia bacterium]